MRVPPVFARSGFTANPLSADVSFMLFYVCNFLFLTTNLCHRPDFFLHDAAAMYFFLRQGFFFCVVVFGIALPSEFTLFEPTSNVGNEI